MCEGQDLLPSDILSVLDHYGIAYKQSGKTYLTNCLFHSDKTPSMVLYPETNSFYCFGCGQAGTPENIVMHMENCSYAQAVKLLYGKGYEWFKLQKKTTRPVTIDMSYLYTILGKSIKKQLPAIVSDKKKLDKLKELILKYSKEEVEPNKLFACLQEIKNV